MEKITEVIDLMDEELVVNGEASYECENDCKHTSSWVLPGMADLGCGIVTYDSWVNPFA
ncbi:hypothetical protein C8E03_102143 [Lachnotalea glycerini]|uniref:Uncharacterized protein n=1 Tax=Lachnotalea glycerini TaxID=1763509 RepID=A0A318EPH9_9FIRM|nr:hypothetical protein [Lachnotalea glycerini]PXV93375.1 hypothetical protein C8E03_102143 [Lachnotalea glycerini]